MRLFSHTCVLLCCVAGIARAQVTDSIATDSTARADSIAREDSLAIERELEGIRSEPQPAATQGGGAVSAAARLLPNISVIGDFIVDASPEGSTQEDGTRAGVREVELALQSVVDPYFRGDFILGLSDLEGIAIEEAYITTASLPWQLQARLGRFHMPLGKQNTTHRAELHTIEYPHVIQQFLGAEAAKGTGLWVSRIFAPLGFFQELQLTAVDQLFGEGHHDEEGAEEEEPLTPEPANRRLSGLGYSARLRNYIDISEAANIEGSLTAATGKHAGGTASCGTFGPGDAFFLTDCPDGLNAGNVRTSLYGLDLTFRWRPLEQGLYKSFILQGEWMRRENHELSESFARNDTVVFLDSPAFSSDGAYLFARYQIGRRLFLGARGDWVEDPDGEDATFKAASAYLQFHPSEFSKIVAMFERGMPSEGKDVNRLVLQATFAIGPHRPHPF